MGEWEGGGEGWLNGGGRGMQGPHTIMPCNIATFHLDLKNEFPCNSTFHKLHSFNCG